MVASNLAYHPIHDRGEGLSIRHARATAFGMRWSWWDQWFDVLPQLVADFPRIGRQFLGHRCLLSIFYFSSLSYRSYLREREACSVVAHMRSVSIHAAIQWRLSSSSSRAFATFSSRRRDRRSLSCSNTDRARSSWIRSPVRWASTMRMRAAWQRRASLSQPKGVKSFKNSRKAALTSAGCSCWVQ